MAEQPKIALCMPLYSGIPPMSFINFINCIVRKRDYPVQLFFTEATEIAVARNQLVNDFLKSDCTHLFFLDSDMLILPDVIDRLLAYDKDVVSALAFTRARGLPAFRIIENGKYVVPLNYPRKSLFETNGASGLGCILIKRKVIEDIKKSVGEKPMFQFVYNSPTDVVGEDVYFCELLRNAGYKIWISSELIVGHFGGIIDEVYYASRNLRPQKPQEKNEDKQ